MIDYLMDDDDDLLFTGGDFAKGESDRQQQRKLLLAEKGEYKQAPTATVGMLTYLKDDNKTELLREIRLRFSDDGMTIQQLGFIGDQINIIAGYDQ